MTPALGWINVLEQLTELREIFYLLDYQSIIKRYNSGRARWKRCIGHGERKEKEAIKNKKDMEKGHRTSTLSPGAPLSPNLHIFTNLEAL